MHPSKSISELIRAADQAGFEADKVAVFAEDDLEENLHDHAEAFYRMADAMKQLNQTSDGRTQFVSERVLELTSRARLLRPIIPFYGLIEASDTICPRGVSKGGTGVR